MASSISHWNLCDHDFIAQFDLLVLDPALFTHEAHLRLCFLYLSQSDLQRATAKINSGIRKFDNTFGDGTKYNESITTQAVKLMNTLMHEQKPSSFRSLLSDNPKLMTDFKVLLESVV